jgi:hypothetical protein
MKRVCGGVRRHRGIHRLAVRAFVALGSTLIVTAAFAQTNLSGRWDLMMDPDFAGNQTTQHCQMKQENRKLTVTCGARPGAAMVGDVNGKSVVWKFVSTGVTPRGWTAAWSGELDNAASNIKGTWLFTYADGDKMRGHFTAQRRPH